jgi:hypothetical protein
VNELSRIIKLSGASRYEAAHGEDTPLVMTLALALLLREQDFDAPLHSAVTDTPSIAEMTFADPLTWGDGVPGSESDTVVRTSSADFACRGMFCVSR